MRCAVFVVLTVVVGAVLCSDSDSWESWKKTYGKEYRTRSEDLARRAVFLSNVQYIADFNSEAGHSYKLAVNQFADLTRGEFKEAISKDSFVGKIKRPERLSPSSTPDGSVDWRTAGCVGTVMDQGECGSSWAIVSVDTAQSDFCAQLGLNEAMSVQQVIDCDKASHGCNGGTLNSAFNYIVSSGLEPASVYPYTGTSGTCKYNSSAATGRFDAIIRVATGDEDDLTTKLTKYGPVAVGIDASTMQFYKSGVFCGPCGTTINHEMMLVAYNQDTKNSLNYWTLQNSWGTGWGMSGYIELCRGKDMCAVADAASCLDAVD
ncbi:cathepsin L2 [Pelomyxa schiedti]|nr:cathepsin L2 [Pelomyxa schiedti]